MTDKLLASPNVIAQQTQEGLCLFHTTRGECYLLNSVGAFLWNYLETHAQQGASTETLVQQISAHYEVPYETALSDLTVFLSEALEAGFIIYADAEA